MCGHGGPQHKSIYQAASVCGHGGPQHKSRHQTASVRGHGGPQHKRRSESLFLWSKHFVFWVSLIYKPMADVCQPPGTLGKQNISLSELIFILNCFIFCAGWIRNVVKDIDARGTKLCYNSG